MGILVHQSTYVHKVLGKFNMGKAYRPRTTMIVHVLERDTNPLRLTRRRRRGVGT
jgi:hypothetical protein